MSSQTAALSETIARGAACGTAAPGPTDDAWERAWLDGQLRLLGRLGEVGLEIAVAAEAEARRPEADLGDVARAYARVSRAVRQAVLLQAKLIKEVKAREAAAGQALADAAARAAEARAEQEHVRKCRVGRIIERIAEAGHDDRERVDRLVDEADERLDDGGLIGDVLDRPVSEIVAQICQDLGLDPDWTRLADEAWAQQELAAGAVGWPLVDAGTCSAEGRTCPSMSGHAPSEHVPASARSVGGGVPPPPS